MILVQCIELIRQVESYDGYVALETDYDRTMVSHAAL